MSGCTKKKCFVDMQRKKASAEQAAARVQQSLPLHGDMEEVEVEVEVKDELRDGADEAPQKDKVPAAKQ